MNKLIKLFLIVFVANFIALTAEVKNNQKTATISPTALTHIKERHWYNNENKKNKNSYFNKSMTVEKVNALATKTINQGRITDSKHAQGRKVHEYTFQRPIGTATNGKKAYTMSVVTEKDGRVVTAYPKN